MTIYQKFCPDLTGFGSEVSPLDSPTGRENEGKIKARQLDPSFFLPVWTSRQIEMIWRCSGFSFLGASTPRLAWLLGISENIYAVYICTKVGVRGVYSSCFRMTRSHLIIFQELTWMKLLPLWGLFWLLSLLPMPGGVYPFVSPLYSKYSLNFYPI